MKLEKLQLFGFKSFADKTEFKFKSGVTGIVGPNGSGKSNIVDAFRWILGEQSAKSLRGADMKDVIFNGTAKRKALGFAEATLAFSNAQDLLGEGNDKLAITRRLYRSGESDYLINGRIARLKDIKDILAGTGVGFNAYSILEQDKIDKILSANPDERRLVFEEAAGISGYRARRKKTERELERTEQYLARLGDIIQELRSRERSVKIQAGRARRYRELTEKIGRMRLDLYALKFRGQSDRMREIDAEIEDVQREANELEGSLRLLESELARKESSMQALGEHLRELQSDKADLQNQAVAAEEKITYGKQRVEELEGRGNAFKADIKTAEERIEKAIDERTVLERRLEKLTSQEQGVEKELKSHRTKIYEASVCLQELEDSLKELREKGAHSLEERSAIRNELTRIGEDSKRYAVNHGRLVAGRDRLSKSREELAGSLDGLEKELESFRNQRAQFEEKFQNTQKKLRETQAQIVRLQQQRSSLNIDRARCQSRLDTLQTLIARHAGVSAGAQYLISRKDEDGFKEVRGILGEMIEVPIENASMVEAVLGRQAQAIVVDTPETAARLARHLRETDSGAAYLVPVQWDEVPYPDNTGNRLVDVIRSKGSCRDILERLAGDVRIVETLEEAFKGFAQNPGLRYVTVSGELVGNGVVCGGSQHSGGIIQRKSEVAALENELTDITKKLIKTAKATDKQEKAHGEFDDKCTKLSTEIENLSAKAGSLEARRGELLRDCSVAETELRTLNVEIGDVESLMMEAKARSKELTVKLKSVEEEFHGWQEKLEASQSELIQARERRESLTEQITAIEVRLARERQERESLAHEMQAKENEIEERRQVRAALETQLQNSVKTSREVKEETQQTGRLVGKLLEKVEKIETAIRDSEEKYGVLEEGITGIRSQRNESAERLRHVESALAEMRVERQACSTQVESVTEYARQELGIEIDEEEIRTMVLPDTDPKVLEEEISTTRQRINRLGNVNMEALDELEEITARLTFYTNQEQDLITSKTKLLEVMAKIDRKCRGMLERSFKDIRKNFQSIFRKLFNGGRADIFFEEGKDILEAGIEVVAKPPGKDLSNLTLLSGGEKAMTTIALLFAIFRSRLSPFCILDEIDAPLDESNVNRFHQLLREFTGECRFLIITHNKVSMAAADVLYGITMQEPGVTKRVSISFEEAAKHASETQEEEAVKETEPVLVGAGA